MNKPKSIMWDNIEFCFSKSAWDALINIRINFGELFQKIIKSNNIKQIKTKGEKTYRVRLHDKYRLLFTEKHEDNKKIYFLFLFGNRDSIYRKVKRNY